VKSSMPTPPPQVPKTKNFLGNYLRKIRLKYGISIRYISQKLCLSYSYIYGLEDGRYITRDKKLIKSWLYHLSAGKENPDIAYKLAMVTYPEMLVRVNKLSVEDRLRLLALIQNIHLKGMPKEVAEAIDQSVIQPNGVVVRLRSTSSNIPQIDKRPVTQQSLKYEDFGITPDMHITDEGTYENCKFSDFLSTPGHEPLGENYTGAFNDK
jgi:hypothetical protein